MRLVSFLASAVGFSYVMAAPATSESDSVLGKRLQDNVHMKFCEHKNFKGRCAAFWISINNDRCQNIGADFNDQISSIDLRSGFGGETGHCRFYE
ncbi:hypothetical protein ACJ41O_007317 [Fusarium nematophilum]